MSRFVGEPGEPRWHFARLASFIELTTGGPYRHVPVCRKQVQRAVVAEYRTIKAFGLREAHEARLMVNARHDRLGFVLADR